MLRLIAGEIDNEDDTQFNKYAFLYREFVTAMTGRSMLRWTPKLRQRLFGDDYEEQSDQEKADYLDENSEQILSLSTEQEKAIRKFNSESHFLRLIEKIMILAVLIQKAFWITWSDCIEPNSTKNPNLILIKLICGLMVSYSKYQNFMKRLPHVN